MKNLNTEPVNRYRDTTWQFAFYKTTLNMHDFGCFTIPSPIDNGDLRAIASSGYEWDHVSVSRKTRCPNWPEMDFIKTLFFNADEIVMQLHVPKKDHINLHPFCLHLWKPHIKTIPLPPKELV
jgi:hypothetical protein